MKHCASLPLVGTIETTTKDLFFASQVLLRGFHDIYNQQVVDTLYLRMDIDSKIQPLEFSDGCVNQQLYHCLPAREHCTPAGHVAIRRRGQAYLRNRSDTVRCIVMGLTDEADGELFNELRSTAGGTAR